MKKAILLTFLLNCGIGISQTEFPFYEQIAFDFYQSTIIDSFPSKKKIKVYPYVMDFHPPRTGFYNPICLGISWKSKTQFKELESYLETQLNIDSDRFELDFSNLDKKKFKIKRNGNGTYPKLQITAPHKEINGTERIFVNIHITNKYLYETYHIEFNDKGKIINWCRTYDEVIRTY
ncbi:hypothetical protein BW723_15915 [Polaribacter reichenbachii]|uniref:Uncharacterized protein n=1 Tax=Polaribacter reichenbachii TaxID=996801 RepID=A0A1B8U291_9FLAO|nr:MULTISPECIES: hypothetical protein [Polaribacter]APZ47398.1 hypothetical protein BW723_14385 [Polaribacter reichenbachii]APZ47686.1 hypothetical protein BW723_15915 [Polaribacter reichenbachii]OBY65962.1 hypothetical protein LPB301_07605 [Polaribacter reichenbachii]UAM97822.1 hypothetical protein K8354_16250 [Polaribacter litorisediminis]